MYVTRFLTAAAAVALMSAPAMAQTATSAPAAKPAPAATTPAAPAATPAAKADIVETARASGQFTTLLKGLDATNLTQVLKTHSGITVFAPTDAAFAALPPGQLDALMKDPAKLQKVLAYHVINLPLPSTKLKGAKDNVASVEGSKLAIDGTGDQIKIDSATVAQADLNATNGTIHVIDRVLIPADVTGLQAAAAPAGAASPMNEPKTVAGAAGASADASTTETAPADAQDATGATTAKDAAKPAATLPANSPSTASADDNTADVSDTSPEAAPVNGSSTDDTAQASSAMAAPAAAPADTMGQSAPADAASTDASTTAPTAAPASTGMAPVADTPENRAKYKPLSGAGRKSAAKGN